MKTLFIVDDNLMMREFLRNHFSKEFNVLVFENGMDVIDSLQELKIPDLIIVDYQMSDISGLELITFLKSSELHKNILTVVLSGDIKSETKIACLKAGAKDYVIKPFNPEELTLRVHKLLE